MVSPHWPAAHARVQKRPRSKACAATRCLGTELASSSSTATAQMCAPRPPPSRHTSPCARPSTIPATHPVTHSAARPSHPIPSLSCLAFPAHRTAARGHLGGASQGRGRDWRRRGGADGGLWQARARTGPRLARARARALAPGAVHEQGETGVLGKTKIKKDPRPACPVPVGQPGRHREGTHLTTRAHTRMPAGCPPKPATP